MPSVLQLPHYANTDARHIVIGMQGATGRWEMSGGTFTVDKTVHVAAKGKGTLAMSGTGGGSAFLSRR